MGAATSNLAVGFCPGEAKAIHTYRRTLLVRLAPKSLHLCGAAHGVKLGSQNAKGGRKRLECRSSVMQTKDGKKLDDLPRKKLAVFVSGGGSNFRSIHEATVRGSVHGDVVVLVTNKLGCGGAQYARDNGVPVILFPKIKSSTEGLSPTELVVALKYSGPTIHFVDEHYDTGCILAQRVVPVLADDTAEQLAGRVLHEEHKLYVEVVEALCEERIIWREDGVPLIQSRENPNEYS